MYPNFDTLEQLRQHHPAWRLLSSPHAPLIASFLHRVFIAPNERILSQADLVEALEDDLFALRERLGPNVFPKTALEYLNDWAGNDKGWLRKFYRDHSDELYFDLTPPTEKAVAWLLTLFERRFVGTESRLLTLFDLLKQIDSGSEVDPDTRLKELQQRRDAIDAEMERVCQGDLQPLNDTAQKERFQQFVAMARELLSDFREVEHNFRLLDRRVRERIALWDKGKGELLEEVLGDRDAISDTDQGRSFHAFWDFLMSSRRQEEFSELLQRVLELPAVSELAPDARTRRIHYDWLAAGEQTQRTVAQLSHQLRRFLDDQAWLENRRIMEILRSIETRALSVRDTPPSGEFLTIPGMGANINLPMERPLHRVSVIPRINDLLLDEEDVDVDTSALFSQIVIDKEGIARHIRHTLQCTQQVSLGTLCEERPLSQGLAELVAYLELADEGFNSTVDESTEEVIAWSGPDRDGNTTDKQARLPRVIFVR